jgi:hypothetical protein
MCENGEFPSDIGCKESDDGDSSDNGEKIMWAGIGGGIGGMVLVIALICFCCYCIHK